LSERSFGPKLKHIVDEAAIICHIYLYKKEAFLKYEYQRNVMHECT